MKKPSLSSVRYGKDFDLRVEAKKALDFTPAPKESEVTELESIDDPSLKNLVKQNRDRNDQLVKSLAFNKDKNDAMVKKLEEELKSLLRKDNH